jgi:hypothetical protein
MAAAPERVGKHWPRLQWPLGALDEVEVDLGVELLQAGGPIPGEDGQALGTRFSTTSLPAP